MGDVWPEEHDLLALERESGEHRRSWALVAGLTKALREERAAKNTTRTSGKLVGPKPESYDDRIRTLEAKLVSQKAVIRQLEECRAFERETEKMLVDALDRIARHAVWPQSVANVALRDYGNRLGPRPAQDQS